MRGLVEIALRIHLRVGRALEPVGNEVDDEGRSLDPRGRPVDPARYLEMTGKTEEELVTEAEPEAETALRAACRQLDKAASKGVIHKNQAANRKSAIAKRLAELQA